MDVMVITGRSTDESELRRSWDAWIDELRGAGVGWLGATAGVSGSAAFVAMVRFVDLAYADGATQTDTWRAVAAQVDALGLERTSRTDVWNRGGSDDAGFVQIRRGVSSDPERLRHLYVVEQPVRMGPYRPEVLGGMFAWHGGDAFTLSAYFTGEDAARSGEHLEAFAPFFADIDAVMQDLTYLDLVDPWLATSSRAVTAGVG